MHRSWKENHDRLPRVGGIATMPSRVHTFQPVLASILPQVEYLFVFFDKYQEVPDSFVDDPKIVPLLPSRFGNLGCCGKFLGVQLHGKPCMYFCFDDDILYPPNYVDVLARALYRNNLRAIVGVHGALFRPPHLSYYKHRAISHFSHALSADCYADELGSGTLAFYTGNFRFDPRHWPCFDMADLTLAIEAVRQGVPRVAIQRPQGFLQALEERQSDSLYERLLKDDSRETEMMREALKSYPWSWQLVGRASSSPIDRIIDRAIAAS